MNPQIRRSPLTIRTCKTMMTSWNETFSALLAICAGNSPVPGAFPAQGSMTRSFDVFLDLRLKKRLSKQSWGWWFETPSCSLWRHSNAIMKTREHNVQTSRGFMEDINAEKSSQGCYKAIQIGFCDSYHNNIIDIQNRLPYSKVVYPALIVPFSCLMEVNHGVGSRPNYHFR